MALTKAYTDKHGLEHSNAYAKINSIYIADQPHEDNPQVTIRVDVYHNEQARTDGKKPITFKTHGYQDKNLYENKFKQVFDGSPSENATKKAYEHIKNNEDFWTDWTDA